MNMTFNNILSFIAVACITALAAGCVKDGTQSGGLSDGEVVRMHISVPAGMATRGEKVSSRAPAGADRIIADIEVLSFDETEGVLRYRATPLAIDPNHEWFDIVLYKSPLGLQRLVVLANLSAEVQALVDNNELIENETTIEELRQRLMFEFEHSTTAAVASTAPTDPFEQGKPLPMWAEKRQVYIYDGVNLGTIYLLRGLASVTVKLDAVLPVGEFRIQDVVIYNTPAAGYAIPAPANTTYNPSGVNRVIVTAPTPVPAVNTGKAYFRSTDGIQVTDRIYIGERDNNAAGMLDPERSWLVISGFYQSDLAATWYKHPFKVKDELLTRDILRNHNYIFSITSVSGRGAPTEEGAMEGDIIADIAVWNMADVMDKDLGTDEESAPDIGDWEEEPNQNEDL